eukprot:TRINITY_DN466_c0_g1_i1.p1 TRINITY_DN466_c0_g1~~TRINITY_DN466_c0_g1_i1.p1  ORF type:complete len:726 (+),score=259.64 TRINITY_DN466_c0_g1_i1:69-2246(+)
MGRSLLVAAAAGVASANSATLYESSSAQVAANPIRKVVTMLEAMKKKVTAEGEAEEALYKRYMCYCKSSGGNLEKSIADAEAKSPEVSSSIAENEAKKQQLDEDLVQHKADRTAAKTAVAEASKIREKEAAAFASTKSELEANIGAIKKALSALEKGMAGSFLQSPAASILSRVVQSREDLVDIDRQEIMSFLASGNNYSPSSGQVTGILKELGDSMSKDLADATAAEDASIKSHEELTAAKAKEIAALTSSIEEKTVRTGEVAVSIVNMKKDLSDTQEALLEDKKFLADLEKNCDTKTAEWDEIVKTRAEELVALSETIKLLQDDDALDLFKKALPSAASSFMQMRTDASSVRARALSLVQNAQHLGQPAQQQLSFIALALHGQKIGFDKVLSMIDEMTALLKKEQEDDEAKKSYCAAEFDSTDDKKKALERSISDSGKAMDSAEEAITSLAGEIQALSDGIKALDKSVQEATEQRKSENEDFKELMAQDSAAKQLISIAKNRLNKFYNPKLYMPPPKRELSEEERIVSNFGGSLAPTPAPGGIAGTGVAVLAQVSAHAQRSGEIVAPPPPPETFGAYSKKSQESTGVIAMMDMLIKDLEKEMTVAETTEKEGQSEYEQTMKDAAEKRAMDAKSLSDKESAKADAEAALQAHKEEKTSHTRELAGLAETISALHGECDWLLQYFDARKEARASEVDSLAKAKAVLSGADFSLLQARAQSFLGRA